MLPLNPAQIPTQFKRALALLKSGQLSQARDILLAIRAVAPKLPEVHFQLGRIAFRSGEPDQAATHLEQAHKLKPAEPAIVAALAEALEAADRAGDAVRLYESVISRNPKDPGPRIDKAFLLQKTGDFDAAEAELRRALKLAPLRGDIYRMLLANKKLKPGDPLIGKMQSTYKDPRLKSGAKVQLGFALAKAMEDTGQTGRVFDYLNPSNSQIKSSYRYDVAERRNEVDNLIRAFSGHDFSPQGPGPEGFSPIFVTGLPRSGTTLVEQILASHSLVTGAGELPHALRLAYNVIGTPGRGFTPMSEVSDEAMAGYGQAYQDAVRRSVRMDRYVTDKAIQSHLVMGMLKQAIPGARFIVVRRDPRDLLYSIYKNMFAEGTHRYAYDLNDLAAYYASFLKMLDFWREALPGGFHEIHYEDLVSNPEPQARALVQAAGLDWEDQCLSFHEAKREVKTLSVQQVRQPIYRTSAQAWKKYETELAPLTEALAREGVL